MAAPRGCWEGSSRAAASSSSSGSDISPAGIISVTLGSPEVMVPVLSRTTISVRPAVSRETAVLNSMPFLAPSPLPTMMATGVASPRAQGQLITSTDIPRARAYPAPWPSSSHTRVVTAAMAMTVGTNMPETLSATFAMGALVAAASLTIWIIWLRVVSWPTRVARHFRKPDLFRVAADTGSPGALSTGTLSPVRALSSSAAVPSSTTPSTGTLSPGRTAKTSPANTCSMGTSVSRPLRITEAVLGASFIRLFNASVVRPFERASRSFPRVIRVSIMPADSK